MGAVCAWWRTVLLDASGSLLLDLNLNRLPLFAQVSPPRQASRQASTACACWLALTCAAYCRRQASGLAAALGPTPSAWPCACSAPAPCPTSASREPPSSPGCCAAAPASGACQLAQGAQPCTGPRRRGPAEQHEAHVACEGAPRRRAPEHLTPLPPGVPCACRRLALTAERWEDDSQAVTLRLAVAGGRDGAGCLARPGPPFLSCPTNTSRCRPCASWASCVGAVELFWALASGAMPAWPPPHALCSCLQAAC